MMGVELCSTVYPQMIQNNAGKQCSQACTTGKH